VQVQFLPQLPVAGTLEGEPVQGEHAATDFLQLWLTLLEQPEKKGAVPTKLNSPENEDEALPEEALQDPEFWLNLLYPQLLQNNAAVAMENQAEGDAALLAEGAPAVAAGVALEPPPELTGMNLQAESYPVPLVAEENSETALQVAGPAESPAGPGENSALTAQLFEAKENHFMAKQKIMQPAGEKDALNKADPFPEVDCLQEAGEAAGTETAKILAARAQRQQSHQAKDLPTEQVQTWEQHTRGETGFTKEPSSFSPSQGSEVLSRNTEFAAYKKDAAKTQPETEQPLPTEGRFAANKPFASALQDLAAVPGDDFTTQVAEQVFEKILFAKLPQGEKKLYVRLKPESLGQVEIRLRLNAKQQLVAHVLTDNFQVKQALEATLGQLRERLQVQQITVTEFTVTLEQEQNFAQQHPWQQNPSPWPKFTPPQRGREALAAETMSYEGPVPINDAIHRTIDLRA